MRDPVQHGGSGGMRWCQVTGPRSLWLEQMTSKYPISYKFSQIHNLLPFSFQFFTRLAAVFADDRGDSFFTSTTLLFVSSPGG
jgi:hypothetical protein